MINVFFDVKVVQENDITGHEGLQLKASKSPIYKFNFDSL